MYIIFLLTEIILSLTLGLAIFLTKNISIASIPLGIIQIIIDLFLFIPSMTIIVRRLHDLNLNGFWFFIDIPIIIYLYVHSYYVTSIIVGLIFTSILLVFKGTTGPNKYGEQPEF